MGKVFIVGIGPGNEENRTIRADRALEACDVIAGYPVYVDLVKDRYPGKELVSTPMTQEARRCQMALELAREGKTVALVGRSGSGKSTIASLITRFYDVDEGQILLDGHDLREYKLSSLRDQVALVSQNVHLFNDTVANNIAYARTEEYSREQIEKWLRLFMKRFFSQQFKRSCIPDGPKVGSVSLSPRGDWRMPSDADSSAWLDL